MNNYKNFINCIEISPFVADAAHKGYSLLSTYSKRHPDKKFRRSLISFMNTYSRSIKEPYSWLHEIISFFIADEIELIDQELIKNYDRFLEFINTLDKDTVNDLKLELTWSLTTDIFESEYESINSLEEFSVEQINLYLEQNPLRVTTASSRLFDISKELFDKMYEDFAPLAFDVLDLYFDLLITQHANKDASTAFHPTNKFKRSISIITWPSTPNSDYDFDVEIFKENFNPNYIELLKNSYYKL